MFLPLPGFDNLGRRVFIVRGSLHNTNTTSMDIVFKATHLVSDIFWEEDEDMSVAGVVQVLDLQGATPSHGLQMTPSLVKKAMTVWQV